MAAIVYRYKWAGFYPFTIQAQVNTTSSFTVQRPSAQSLLDVDYDDTFPKVDLDGAMAALGWEYVSTNPAVPIAGLYQGAGSPEGAVTANVGALYQDTNTNPTPTLTPTLWVKTSGTGNTGWSGILAV